MSRPGRTLLQLVVTIGAIIAFAGALWWAVAPPKPEAASGSLRPTIAEPVLPTATAFASTPTPMPTATPSPTATPVPVPVSIAQLLGRPDLEESLQTPLPGCGLTAATERAPEADSAGTIPVRCIEDWSSVDVTAMAPGRVVHIVDQPASDLGAIDLDAGADPARWSWSSQAMLGPHVVVDHGPYAGSSNMQTVYAGISAIADGLVIGQVLDTDTVLGVVLGPHAELDVSLWDTNVRHDGVVVVEEAPDAQTQRTVAAALGALIGSPTDPECPLILASGQLPGATRDYRNGTHQGIDFGCGTADRYGTAIADGTVAYLVDDYVDPSVVDREALLHNAELAGFTPHWTLAMLYGNVVIVDHGVIPGAGRVHTISAHLESVDPAITLGASVMQGQILGELGNRGTNASAQGLRGAQDPSLHLHWELFIDNWYLGAGQPPGVVSELVQLALCGSAATAGCPG